MEEWGVCKHLNNYWDVHKGRIEENEGILIGDRVRIVIPGSNYSTYTEWAEWACATKWKFNEEVFKGQTGIVRHIGLHRMDKPSGATYELALIDLGLREVIMSIDAIEFLEEVKGGNKIKGIPKNTPDYWNMTRKDFINKTQEGSKNGSTIRPKENSVC